jgi:hypothetical protein
MEWNHHHHHHHHRHHQHGSYVLEFCKFVEVWETSLPFCFAKLWSFEFALDNGTAAGGRREVPKRSPKV